jgi:hypothetical protein
MYLACYRDDGGAFVGIASHNGNHIACGWTWPVGADASATLHMPLPFGAQRFGGFDDMLRQVEEYLGTKATTNGLQYDCMPLLFQVLEC